MKKLLKLAGLTVLVTALSVTTIFAASKAVKITGNTNPTMKITVDGKATTFKDSANKVIVPVNINGTNYVPVKALADITGKSYTFDSKANTAIIGTKKVPKWVEGFPKSSGAFAKITNKKFLDYQYEETPLNSFKGIMMTADDEKTVGKIKVKDKFSGYIIATNTGKVSWSSESNIRRAENARCVKFFDKDKNLLATVNYANGEFNKPIYIELDELGENELTVQVVSEYNYDEPINCIIIDPKTMVDTNN